MIKPDELLEIVTTAIIVFDGNGVCVTVNDASQRMLHKSKRWLIGQQIETIFVANQQAAMQCRLALKAKRKMILREVDLHLPEWKRSLLLDFKLSPFENEEKEGIVLEMIDTKKFKELTQATEKESRIRVTTHMIRTLCHEIRNPLGGIRGATQLLEMETDDHSTTQYTQVIRNEVDRLDGLLSRMSSGDKGDSRVKIDIHDILTQSTHVIKAEYADQFQMRFDFDSSLPALEINVGQIEQVLLNLIRNAVQWAVDERRDDFNELEAFAQAAVSIKTRAAYPDLMRSLMPQNGIRIQIIDNGPGVDSSLVDQLFLPMVSQRRGGTGLGLVISQEIVQRHSGFIELDENQAEKGASFSIYLPYMD